ncbi:MAG: alpha/beta hydrolase [Myxococcota bacterium]|jgi:hypothetical protein|nr:alpha/beta hydrolase [Myxococcota bacterium]
MSFVPRIVLCSLLTLASALSACNESADRESTDSQTIDSTDTGTNTGDTVTETGTDTGTVTDTEDNTATETETQSDTETEADTTTPGDGYCRYSIFSYPVCRKYLENWTEEERIADCAVPFVLKTDPGVLDGTPCSTAELLGTCQFDQTKQLGDNCVHEQPTTHPVKDFYYTGPVDTYESSCTGLLNGTWETENTDLPDWRGPMEEALPALVSDSDVTVSPDDCSNDTCMLGLYEEKGWFTFTPVDVTPTIGLIFWPGGNVDARSYAVVTRTIADAGVLVVLPLLPPNIEAQAQDIMDANAGIASWYFGGHSMGGATAQQLAFTNPEMVSGGLVLFAAPGSDAADLSAVNVDVLEVTATLDGLNPPTEFEETKIYLPPDTTYVAIEGGNHAQFGHYGEQNGDDVPTISREEQQAQAVAAALAFMGIAP